MSTQLLDKATAYWYACGYNDHREPAGVIGAPWSAKTSTTRPYVDAAEFAEYWLSVCSKPSHPSLQDAFKAYVKATQEQRQATVQE